MLMCTLPDAIHNPDFADLIDLCRSYMEEQIKGKHDTDTKDLIFEEAMIALFGKGIFKVLQELITRENNPDDT